MVDASPGGEREAGLAVPFFATDRAGGWLPRVKRWWALVLFAFAIVAVEGLLFRIHGKGGIFWGYGRPRHGIGPFLETTYALFAMAALVVRAKVSSTVHCRAPFVIGLASAALASIVGLWVLRSFPNSGDEYAYLFQEWTYAAGRLWKRRRSPPGGGRPCLTSATLGWGAIG